MTRYHEFRALHVPGRPLVLFNVWDAGTARAVEEAGARALATGSWSVAAANGYDDGEQVPLEFVFANADRIVRATSLPVSVDLERGYGGPHDAATHVARLQSYGVAGVNIEDGLAAGGCAPVDEQTAKLAAIKSAAPDVFLNARHDAFLGSDPATHAGMVDDAIARGRAYADAGADGYFVPGLADPGLIERVVEGVGLPVNIMASDATPPLARLAALGVARVSHGPGPYLAAMSAITEAARTALA